MKKTLFILGLLFIFNAKAQETALRRFSLSFAPNLPISLGDNFLHKGYSNAIGFDSEIQLNVRRNLLIGMNFQQHYFSSINSEIIGDFSSAYSNSFHGFAGYRNFLKNNKMYFESRLGFGSVRIKNYSALSNYDITGNDYFIGTKFNYSLNDVFTAFIGLEYNHTKYDVILEGPYQNFYSVSDQLVPTLGIKLSFGRLFN
jgi:hypothetical protein